MPDVVLDCRGMRCPRSIVEMAKKMRNMEPGQTLELWATDQVALHDVPAWCQKTGNPLSSQEQEGELLKFFVKKA
ncbi:MAG: sulfurtransferase TusA family protein [Dehalococcoidia bacterium]|nr:sulfurtransferase TusA family protein [Dehalococcoidia bacterium]